MDAFVLGLLYAPCRIRRSDNARVSLICRSGCAVGGESKKHSLVNLKTAKAIGIELPTSTRSIPSDLPIISAGAVGRQQSRMWRRS
jgi:hypothetical protein